jgi:hypothetical protein
MNISILSKGTRGSDKRGYKSTTTLAALKYLENQAGKISSIIGFINSNPSKYLFSL